MLFSKRNFYLNLLTKSNQAMHTIILTYPSAYHWPQIYQQRKVHNTPSKQPNKCLLNCLQLRHVARITSAAEVLASCIYAGNFRFPFLVLHSLACFSACSAQHALSYCNSLTRLSAVTQKLLATTTVSTAVRCKVMWLLLWLHKYYIREYNE